MNVFKKLIFGTATEPDPKLPDPTKRLVEIQLAGAMHAFYTPLNFVEQLCKTLDKPNVGGFFQYDSGSGTRFAINLDCIDFVHLPDESYHLDSKDPEGYSVHLVGRNKPIKLGMLNEEQLGGSIDNQNIQYLRMGNYYFNRDDVALIVNRE